MKKIVTMSLVAAMAMTSAHAVSNSALAAKLSALEAELAAVKKDMKKQKKKINQVRAHDANDNIKWGVDLRTAIDNINYDMADGSSQGKNDLMSLRLWLNMAYAPDSHNIFKGQLSMHKAFGADFGLRGWGMDNFDWVTNEALTNDNLRVRQAYWLYLGEKAFGADIPWTFSIGRRPSTNGFLANLRDDDAAQSPLGHIINVEFDGLSSKLDLSNVTGVPGMSIKLCMGQGSTNAAARFTTSTDYANIDGAVNDIALAGFIFEPYNDGQYIVKSTYYKAFDLPDLIDPMNPSLGMENVGDMEGAALSVLVDGLSDDGILADTKVFGSLAWSKTRPDSGKTMLGSAESETGTSYWFGAQVPVLGGKLGAEFNHGSQYWRPFTYAEDTMIGSKLAARGDAFEVYYTYQLTESLSAQLRYTSINYDYTGSNGFFGSTTGASYSIDDLKAWAAGGDPMAQGMLPYIVEKAQDARFYIRYRF
ncbi:DUF3373 family protein [Sulfurovum sp. ST-21]|uniref:DUF3373 family protein n=1 Tax=Sulfurovum indicum TaxID=2779528 RepID=A0A7M1S340_9BACT|nr:DUF3373 family protein [Sulfurovum indicum]QOR61853.1 DUF3373 family protein [Sulfurovum indicum]